MAVSQLLFNFVITQRRCRMSKIGMGDLLFHGSRVNNDGLNFTGWSKL
jgi:hypothetical protein